MLHVFASQTPIVGSLRVFLKILKSRATLIFQVNSHLMNIS